MNQTQKTEANGHRIVQMPAIRLAGLMRRYPATPETMQKLGLQWMEFAQGPGGKLLVGRPVMYGIHTGLFGDSGEEEYFSGVEIAAGDAVPAGLTAFQVPAARCAVIDHDGTVGEISRTTSTFLRQDIHGTGHRLAAARAFDLIERYGKGFDPQTARGDIQLVIPVEG